MYVYRFTDWTKQPHLESIDVIKETKCGYWIMDTCKWPNKNRWISKDGHYAHPTKEEALKSYIVRKQYHLKHLENRMSSIKELIYNAKHTDLSTKMLPLPKDYFMLSLPKDYFSSMEE
jgi:hypothetical protein